MRGMIRNKVLGLTAVFVLLLVIAVPVAAAEKTIPPIISQPSARKDCSTLLEFTAYSVPFESVVACLVAGCA